jgi:Methylase involved in ubiquinone/menaquinone biosynthesis
MPIPEFEHGWQQRYDNWAAKYNDDHLIAGWSAEGLSRRLALLLEVLPQAGLPPGSSILDLGAGPGTYTRALGRLGYDCIGLDFSRNVIHAAKRKSSSDTYIQGDAYNLPFRNSVFGAVVCIGVLQSLSRPAIALGEMSRVLAPGGSLFLDGLNRLFWLCLLTGLAKKDDKKLKYYSPREIKIAAERAGFIGTQIHWLAVPRWSQLLARSARGDKISPIASILGHSFLLHAKKA